MRILILSYLVLLSAITALAQGKVEISGADKLEEKIKQKVEETDTTQISGYRIQIYFGHNRNEALAVESKFKSYFSEWSSECYVVYYEPNWRVRVGNYYSKIDAQPMMKELQKEFDNVFLIRDKITLPVLR
ncbi:MAG: hypothetical protein GC181_03980 [Bacteroidetes bacterium]|nr:hypothetical protein [Bacteroidota bacterium]